MVGLEDASDRDVASASYSSSSSAGGSSGGIEMGKLPSRKPWIVARSAAASLSLVTWFEQMPPGALQGVVFEVDDVDGEHARLTAAGVRFEGPLTPPGPVRTLDAGDPALHPAEPPEW